MRRDPIEIIQEMFRILEKEHEAMSINQIAKKTGIHNITVKRYVELIEMIRDEPSVEVIKTGHTVIVRIQSGTVKRIRRFEE
jgi:DNA invertase Pin-like site-specific DNA recombinase